MFNFPVAPDQASTFAGQSDLIFWIISALTVVFTVIVGLAVMFFAIRYRNGSNADRSKPVHDHHVLEIVWSVIPAILGLIMFYMGASQYIHENTPPKDCMEVFVIGKQWMWHFQHDNGIRENNTLHVPMGKPVRLTMISQDVIHALYIPEFRVQRHVVPGRYTQLWFQPSKTGTFHLFCSMFCGTQHSEMGGTVVVMTPTDYNRWLESGGNDTQPMTMASRGEEIFANLRCGTCHGPSDTVRGPALSNLFGKTRRFTNGGAVVADPAYIRESIINPEAQIVQGYINTMPSYKSLREEDVLELMAYMKDLGAPPAMKPENSPQMGTASTDGGKKPKMAVGVLGAQNAKD
jgi:cytochrome c oxidase subunit II